MGRLGLWLDKCNICWQRHRTPRTWLPSMSAGRPGSPRTASLSNLKTWQHLHVIGYGWRCKESTCACACLACAIIPASAGDTLRSCLQMPEAHELSLTCSCHAMPCQGNHSGQMAAAGATLLHSCLTKHWSCLQVVSNTLVGQSEGHSDPLASRHLASERLRSFS